MTPSGEEPTFTAQFDLFFDYSSKKSRCSFPSSAYNLLKILNFVNSSSGICPNTHW